MTSRFYVQDASFDINYRDTGTVSLGLVCNIEDSKKLFSIIDESQGKIQISKFEEKDPSVAEKFRQRTVETTIKGIYDGIGKTIDNYGFSFHTYLSSMSAKSLTEIVKEFTDKGFLVDNKIDYLKISWY